LSDVPIFTTQPAPDNAAALDDAISECAPPDPSRGTKGLDAPSRSSSTSPDPQSDGDDDAGFRRRVPPAQAARNRARAAAIKPYRFIVAVAPAALMQNLGHPRCSGAGISKTEARATDRIVQEYKCPGS